LWRYHHCRRHLSLLRPRGHSSVARWLTRCRRTHRRPRHPRGMLPRRRGHSRPEHLRRCEGGNGRRHPVNKKAKGMSAIPSKSEVRKGKRYSAQVGKPRFLFLEGSGAASVAPAGPREPLPVTRRQAPLRPPWAPTPRPPLRPVGTGVGDSTSRGPHASRHFLPPLPPPPMMSSPAPARGGGGVV
jgi:hypothetical protein